MKETLVVNLYGGPGAGKSTAAARIFAELKTRGISCELVTEYAKDLTWQKSFSVLENQIYVLGKQYQRMHRVLGQVDVIVTDSPLLLSIIYNHHWFNLAPLALEAFNSMNHVDYFLTRQFPYDPIGRNQDELAAKAIDVKIKGLLVTNDIIYHTKPGSVEGALEIVEEVIKELEK